MQEFASRHNIRNTGTLKQMGVVVRALEGRYITYTALTEPNGLSSGARQGFISPLMNNNRSLHQSSLDLWPGETTTGQALERIRTQSRDETEKGCWFENLVKQMILNRLEMEVAEVHRWSEWPDREELTVQAGRDLGTDLVARLQDGSWVAIQCKCHAREHRVPKSEINSFLSHSQREPFALR